MVLYHGDELDPGLEDDVNVAVDVALAVGMDRVGLWDVLGQDGVGE